MAVTSFIRDFDEIVNEILVDYINLDNPPPDTSRGSMPYIFANVMANQSYGLNAKINFIANQIGPIPATSGEFLDRYGSIYNLPRTIDESDANYYLRIRNRQQNPPSGGNANDYKVWALDRTNVSVTDGANEYYNEFATITDAYPKPGNVYVATIPNDETIIDQPGPPNNEELLRQRTFDYIEGVRPIAILGTVVVSAKPIVTDVAITVIIGTDWNQPGAVQDITDYMNNLAPGESLYVSKLQSLCINNGALSATVVNPPSDISINRDRFLRPGTIIVTEILP